ncbi:MAG: 17, gp16 [Acidobacteria bacterium]|nr:17, gp16 [Acidobacteriota bacterium]
MKNLFRWSALFLLPMIALLAIGGVSTALAHTTALSVSMAVQLGGVAFMGQTTGTKASGSDFIGMSDMMKNVYTEAFENNVEADSELSDMIEAAEGFTVVDGPDGKQITLGHIFSSGGGVGAMNEDDYLYTATAPTTKQSSLTIKQLTATVELSGRTLRRVKAGPAAFVSWADEALPRKAARLAFQRDRMWIGAGTGVIGRYNGTPDATGDPINAAHGITGLEGAVNLLLRDDNLRAATSAAATTLRVGTMKVTLVDYVNNAINTDQLATGAATGDYLFLGDNNVNSSGSREPMGFEGLIDDGNVLGTIQGLSRTTYPELKSQVIDSTDATLGFGSTLNEDILDYADSLCYERGNLGRPKFIVCNRSGQRSFWKSLKADRVLNDPKGNFTGGKAKLKMILGDRIVEVRAARKVSVSRCYGIDPRTIKKYRVGAGRWDDTDGSVWNRVVDGSGRKDAFFAVYVSEEEVGIGDPAQSFKITGLAAA